MRTIIAGSRSLNKVPSAKEWFFRHLNEIDWLITEVISGTATGPDQWGIEWALYNEVPVTKFPANWPKFGVAAGYQRNIEMGKYGEALVLAWDGFSKGSGSMLDIARRLGYSKISVFEIDV